MTNAKRAIKDTTNETVQATIKPTRIIHKATCKPIFPAANGELTYNKPLLTLLACGRCQPHMDSHFKDNIYFT